MRFRTLTVGTLAVFLAAAGLFGQEYRGSILGRVVDPTGAIVPGAKVTVTNTATNVPFKTETNADGDYRIPYLQPGFYSLRVEHQGFKSFERNPIELRIDALVQVDARLELGSSTETMTVKAETPLLDAASASEGQTIEARRLEELPIQQGVPFEMIALSTGMTSLRTTFTDEHPYDNTVDKYSLGGAGPYTNVITIDGAPQQGTIGAFTQPTFSPPQESVNEFRVLTSSFDA